MKGGLVLGLEVLHPHVHPANACHTAWLQPIYIYIYIYIITYILLCKKYLLNVKCDVFNLFRAQSKFIVFFTNQTSAKHQLKVKIFPCVLYSIQLFVGGIIIIIFVDILKVGSMDEAVW